MPELFIGFHHGLGDCVHFAQVLQLYRRRGFGVTVDGEENKSFVWRVAGAEPSPGPLPEHPWGYPEGFDDLAQDDILQNKIAFNLNLSPLPDLGEKRALWEELTGVRLTAHEHIGSGAHEEADHFLSGLPRPIVCLHSNGTNFSEQKNMPIAVSFMLIIELLRGMNGSIIVLDWDSRAPSLGDDRVRSLKPWWGHISCERLAALYERAALMIGVDSGPFHFASFFPNLKVVGVFHEIAPNRCCIPNPNAVYMVPAAGRQYWRTRSGWNFIEYPGSPPTAGKIAEVALRILQDHPA